MVPCPAVVAVYNSHMGNVDLLDSNIGRHHIKMRSKRWYMRLFFHLVDMTVINSWILYRRMLIETGATDTPMNQKKFRIDSPNSVPGRTRTKKAWPPKHLRPNRMQEAQTQRIFAASKRCKARSIQSLASLE